VDFDARDVCTATATSTPVVPDGSKLPARLELRGWIRVVRNTYDRYVMPSALSACLARGEVCLVNRLDEGTSARADRRHGTLGVEESYYGTWNMIGTRVEGGFVI
jgi:hypothetical protein